MSKPIETVLILGAGASQPYGFPLGVGLRDLICDGLSKIALPHVLAEMGFGTRILPEFSSALPHSGYSSVDAFLEAQPRFMEIGKAAIAIGLLPFERPKHLFPPHAPSGNHWYEALFNLLDVGSRNAASQRTAIVTFNYDRSLEHYLFTVLRTRKGLTEKSAADRLKRVRIIHLHGQLGDYPGLGPNSVPYGHLEASIETLKEAASRIRVVSEVSDLAGFREAGELLSYARRAYFLGFGFAPISLDRLRSQMRSHPDIINGTSKAIPDRVWRAVKQQFFPSAWPRRRFRGSLVSFLRGEAVFGS